MLIIIKITVHEQLSQSWFFPQQHSIKKVQLVCQKYTKVYISTFLIVIKSSIPFTKWLSKEAPIFNMNTTWI